MVYSRVSSNYKRSSIETAGKLDLVIMCYEKAILCLNQVKMHIREQEYQKKAVKVKKALDIINELQTALDIEKGELIAKNLDSIYSYLTNRILLGDIQKNLSVFDECVNILEELKAAWVEISHSHAEEDAEEIVESSDEHDNRHSDIRERIMMAV